MGKDRHLVNDRGIHCPYDCPCPPLATLLPDRGGAPPHYQLLRIPRIFLLDHRGDLSSCGEEDQKPGARGLCPSHRVSPPCLCLFFPAVEVPSSH